MFHIRTQAFTRGKTGVIVEFRPDWVIPEDEAWGRDTPERGGREEPFYVVRFKQKDLWPNYTGFDIDTLETEVAQRWFGAGEGGRQVTQTHDHDHESHAPIQSSSGVSEFEVLEIAVRELAIEKRLFSAEDHRVSPNGRNRLACRVVRSLSPKAWVDPDFKARLLADGTEACKEVGIDWLDPTGTGTPSDYTYFYVLENTPKVHNIIVCTLCSCYPRSVVGMSPDWYRTPHYRRRLVRWPGSTRASAAICS